MLAEVLRSVVNQYWRPALPFFINAPQKLASSLASPATADDIFSSITAGYHT